MRVERRFAEIRQGQGRRLEGVAIRYREIATGLPFRERIEPRAFGELAGADVILNVGHDRARPIARTGGGGLALADGPDALTIRAELPETREADDALALVRSRVLRGLSIEFRTVAERMENGVRVIERAILDAVALVDQGAYNGATVEARRKNSVPNPWLRAQWAARKAGACDCQGPAIQSVVFEPGAWREAVASDREVLAVAGDYGRALASRRKGTLGLAERDDGGLDISMSREAAETPAGRDLQAMAPAVPLTARPIVDNEQSEFEDTDGVRTFTQAHLRAVLIKPTDRPDGWEPAEIERGETDADRRRWRLWL